MDHAKCWNIILNKIWPLPLKYSYPSQIPNHNEWTQPWDFSYKYRTGDWSKQSCLLGLQSGCQDVLTAPYFLLGKGHHGSQGTGQQWHFLWLLISTLPVILQQYHGDSGMEGASDAIYYVSWESLWPQFHFLFLLTHFMLVEWISRPFRDKSASLVLVKWTYSVLSWLDTALSLGR